MAIDITPEIEALVQGIYAEGKYSSQAEVLTVALHLLQKREQLSKDLQQGIRELDSGQRLEAETVFASLRKRASELDERSS